MAESIIGSSIGHYRVTEKIGSGGMGEVYRARDSRLGRDVALKVLPEIFAADPQRMARFEREAKLLASLNHPNIAAIYGLELSGGNRTLVMELVEGPTLAERITPGPLVLDEALNIARQIAEALEFAHEKGVIHRDLKPANVKVTSEGQVKVLDFGLAKALEGEASDVDISNSPTISMAATRAGIILGTAAYMSPEQAKGRSADRRADVWSFGVVLYEMLTGRQLFTGETASDTLAAVLRADPDWFALPAGTPAPIRKLIERCLRRDVKARLQAIGEARIAIEEFLANSEASSSSGISTAAAKSAPQPLLLRALPWALVAVLTLVASVALWRSSQSPANPGIIRLSAEFGGAGTLYTEGGPAAILSPDGTHMVLVVQEADNKRRLFIRSLDQLLATPLAGTENAIDPFFSPDGRWIAFFADGKLKKISAQGGAAVTLCDSPENRGGAWSEDGAIVFAPETRVGLSMISSAGGTPKPFSTLDRQTGEVTHRRPQFLPGGKAVLFTSSNDGNNYEDADIFVQLLATGERKKIYHGGYNSYYLSSGHLVFIHNGTLFGVPFDLKRLEVQGEPVPILEEVVSNPGNAGTQFSASISGTFLYVAGKGTSDWLVIDWLTPDGKFSPFRKTPGNYWDSNFSPDGKLLAMDMDDGKKDDIWVYDWQRDIATRLTFTADPNRFPTWFPDGRRVSFITDEKTGGSSISWKRADGAGDAQRLVVSKTRLGEMAWRPDGKFLAFRQINPDTRGDIMVVSLEGDDKSGWKPGEVKPFLNSPAAERLGEFSPDGRWLAYFSNESGAEEVYVRPFPGPGGKWQISTKGGNYPQWSRNGRELFYRAQDNQLMVVSCTASGDSFHPGTPRPWTEVRIGDAGRNFKNYVLHPDGKRVAVIRLPEGKAATQASKVSFIFNFSEEIRRKLAPAQP